MMLWFENVKTSWTLKALESLEGSVRFCRFETSLLALVPIGQTGPAASCLHIIMFAFLQTVCLQRYFDSKHSPSHMVSWLQIHNDESWFAYIFLLGSADFFCLLSGILWCLIAGHPLQTSRRLAEKSFVSHLAKLGVRWGIGWSLNSMRNSRMDPNLALRWCFGLFKDGAFSRPKHGHT